VDDKIKICPICHKTYPLTAEFFNRNGGNKSGYHTYCKTCHVKKNLEWSRKHPKNRRKWKLKRKYGIELEWYEALFNAQGGVCAICGKAETEIGSYGPILNLSVDHDHSTGKVRGLLCTQCNRGLGVFRDDPAVLVKAAKYLLDRVS
jgi:hypothetical protein